MPLGDILQKKFDFGKWNESIRWRQFIFFWNIKSYLSYFCPSTIILSLFKSFSLFLGEINWSLGSWILIDPLYFASSNPSN